MAGGTAYNNAVKAATAKGQAEQEKQSQTNAQQQAQSRSQSSTPQNGGQGKPYDPVTNPYGVQFVGYSKTSVENQASSHLDNPSVSPSAVLKDTPQNDGQPDWTSKANEYARSLVVNAGLQEGSKDFQKAMQNYLKGNNLQIEKTNDRASSNNDPQIIKPSENYGYSVKVSPIISKNFAKNPENVNFDLEKTRPAIQARNTFKAQFSNDQGGITTPQSKGKSYGYDFISKQTQNIGTKIFSNQVQLSRGSPLEDKVKAFEAKKAESKISFEKPKSDSSSTVKQPSISFGWKDMKSTQISRGSPLEDTVKANEANKASSIYPSYENKSYELGGGKSNKMPSLIDPNALKESLNIFRYASKNNVPVKDIPNSLNSVFDFAQKNNIKTLDVFDTSGNKLGSVQANKNGLQALNDISASQSLIVRTPPSSSLPDLKEIGVLASKGALITVSDKNGKYLGFASGSNAELSFAKLLGKSDGQVNYSVLYPKEEKSLIANIKANPAFYEKRSQSFWDTQYKNGFLQPNDMALINGIFHDYDRQQNAGAKENVKQLSENVSQLNKAGVSFTIYDKSGNIVGSTSGQRSFYDIMKAETKYGNINFKPNYNFTLEQTGKLLTQPIGKPAPDNISAIGDYFKGAFGYANNSLMGSIANLESIGAYGLKTAESLRLENGQIVATDKNSQSKFVANLKGMIPIKLGSLAKGTVTPREAPPLTHRSQALVDQKVYPTALGASMGTEKENMTREYYTGSQVALFGSVALAAYGLKSVIPEGTGIGRISGLKVVSPIETVIGKTSTGTLSKVSYKTSDLYRGLTINGNPIIGKTPRGLAIGKPKEFVPQGSKLTLSDENVSRGLEFYTQGKTFQKLVTNNPDFLNELLDKGYLARGEDEIRANELRKSLVNEIMSNEVPQRSKEFVSNMESVTPTVETSFLDTIGKQQSSWNIFKIKKGKANEIQGSRATSQFLDKEGLAKLENMSPIQDVDIIKSNAFANKNNVFGIIENYQAVNLAKELNLKAQQAQGIAPEENTVFRGINSDQINDLVSGKIDLEKTSSTPEIYTSPDIGTASFFGKLANGKNYDIAKISLESEKDILNFKKIPKSVKGSNPIANWRSANPRMIKFASSKRFKGLRKPIKTGGEETILFDTSIVKDIGKVSKNVQITRQEERKVYSEPSGNAEGGKSAEYVTSRDETGGSSSAKTGKVMGFNIDKTTYKATVKATGRQVGITSGKFQVLTNEAKKGIQTFESAKAQNATPEQLAYFEGGKKILITSEAFAPKAVVRPYIQYDQLARDLMKNPKTVEKSIKIKNMNEELFDIEAPYHNLSRDTLAKSANPKAERESINETANSLYSSSNIESSKILKSLVSSSLLSPKSNIPNSRFESKTPSKTSRSSESKQSSFSRLSSLSIKSAVSFKSGKSARSSHSALSNLSEKYGNSGSSSKSGLSGLSGRSAKSGISGLSARSGLSSLSGLSGLSNMSGIGNARTTTITPVKISPIYGAFTKRRNYKEGERPTKTFLHDVNNVFASSLSLRGNNFVTPRTSKSSKLFRGRFR